MSPYGAHSCRVLDKAAVGHRLSAELAVDIFAFGIYAGRLSISAHRGFPKSIYVNTSFGSWASRSTKLLFVDMVSEELKVSENCFFMCPKHFLVL